MATACAPSCGLCGKKADRIGFVPLMRCRLAALGSMLFPHTHSLALDSCLCVSMSARVRASTLQALSLFLDFFQCYRLLGSCESIVLCEEEHTMALFPFPHGHARAVPESVLHLRFLVVIVATGAKRRSQLLFVLCQALLHALKIWIQALSITTINPP